MCKGRTSDPGEFSHARGLPSSAGRAGGAAAPCSRGAGGGRPAGCSALDAGIRRSRGPGVHRGYVLQKGKPRPRGRRAARPSPALQRSREISQQGPGCLSSAPCARPGAVRRGGGITPRAPPPGSCLAGPVASQTDGACESRGPWRNTQLPPAQAQRPHCGSRAGPGQLPPPEPSPHRARPLSRRGAPALTRGRRDRGPCPQAALVSPATSVIILGRCGGDPGASAAPSLGRGEAEWRQCPLGRPAEGVTAPKPGTRCVLTAPAHSHSPI